MTYRFTIFVILLFTCGYLQNAETGSPFDSSKKHIKYIGQFSGIEQNNSESGFFERLFKLISGKKEQNLQRPFNIAMKDSNHIYVIDQGNQGLMVQTLSDRFYYSTSSEKLTFSSPVGVCMLNDFSALFTDSKLNMIFIHDDTRLQPRQWETDVALSQPTGITFNSQTKHIWVAETGRHCLSIFDRNGRRIKQIGNRGTDEGQFNFPTFICTDDSGLVYVVDSMNFRVQIFDSAGRFITMFGQAGDASGYFARPKGVAVDSDGYIYIVDALFHNVQVFNQSARFLYAFGNQGQGNGEFWMPAGIHISPENRIYIADTYNSRVQIFQRIDE